MPKTNWIYAAKKASKLCVSFQDIKLPAHKARSYAKWLEKLETQNYFPVYSLVFLFYIIVAHKT